MWVTVPCEAWERGHHGIPKATLLFAKVKTLFSQLNSD